jgi:general secretion pathway protein F
MAVIVPRGEPSSRALQLPSPVAPRESTQMPSFAFSVATRAGARHRGIREASTAESLAESLRSEGLFVLDVAPSAAGAGMRGDRVARRARRDLLEITRALASLLPAGLPLPKALDAAARMGGEASASILAEVRGRVERGERLSAALAAHKEVFPPHYIGLVAAGERGGDIAGAFTRLSEQLEREAAIRGRLISAAVYPLVLAIAGGAAMLVLLLVVLPNFARLLSDAGTRLPPTTALVLAISGTVRRFWYVIPIVVVAAIVGLEALRSRPQGRLLIAQFIARLPLVGNLVRDIAAARFARLTGTLLAGGAPLLAALENATASLGSPLAEGAATRARSSVREGGSLNAALAREDAFPPLLAQLAALGEESARLDEFLLKAATLFEERTARTVQRLVALAEPAMIVVFGGIIGFVALSLLQAIYSVNAGSFR